ncbi:hypothetical protein GAR96_22110 [Salmonella enterica]|nr:hypothetical protein [Salmonella enterica]
MPLTARRPLIFAGVQGAQVTARQRRRLRNGGCKPAVDVATVGWKPVRAETVYRLRLRQPRFPSGKSPAVMASEPVRQQANLKS